jgi:hypothetical protein
VATSYWLGDAQPVAQVNTVTVGGTPANGQVYTVTINRKIVTYTATGTDTNATIAESLQATLAASTFAEFQEVTWTYPGSGSVVTGTAATAGVPFTNTSGATGTGTLVTATSTASSGPNDASVAANYSPNSVPVNGDDLVIQETSSPILYGLTALSGVSLASARVFASFTGTIGLPDINPAGYVEYRTTALALGGNPVVTIGEGEGSGSSLLRLKVGTGTCAVVVEKTGPNPSDAPAPVMLWNSAGNNTLTVLDGNVAVAAGFSETAEFSTVVIGGGGGTPAVQLGAGTTVGTSVSLNSGTCNSLVTVPQLNMIGGTHTQEAGTLTNVTCRGGTVVYRTTGTTTQATFAGPSAKCDCTADPRSRTFTDSSFTGGASLQDPAKSVTFTNPATFDAVSLAASVLGQSMTIQRT